LWFDQIQHHLRGDAGISGATAFAQDRKPSLGRQRIGGDDHVLLGLDQRLRGEAGRNLRGLKGVGVEHERRCAKREQKGEQGAEEEARGVRHAPEHSSFRRANHPLTRLVFAPWLAVLPGKGEDKWLMEIAGFGDDALGSGVVAWMEALSCIAGALAAIGCLAILCGAP
jgi:hypothetical protein